ncbi:MAG: putative Na+/H+ antiporter [Puniceicoccales bacterium]|nr:putative Na+/H+ antiporter [Puniceicoccales bacterium]
MFQLSRNVVPTLFFFAAIGHTFCAGAIARRARRIVQRRDRTAHIFRMRRFFLGFCGRLCHLLGEVELPFILWAIPSLSAVAGMGGAGALRRYLFEEISFAEPVFIVVIMAMAATRPVLSLAKKIIGALAGLGHGTVAAWWFAILLAAPPLGSFLTEPAAVTIAALLLGEKFYGRRPSAKLAYGTLGLLFTNISVGGALTNFAAPPILMVAHRWHWTTSHVFFCLGLRALCGIILATCAYGLFFRKELAALGSNSPAHSARDADVPCPIWLSISHVVLMAWTIGSIHSPIAMAGGLVAFLALVRLTFRHQSKLRWKESFFVGVFLAGLALHGGLQGWWIEPLLSDLGPFALFGMAAFLSSFNDNAAVTYLTALVPSVGANGMLQRAVLAGAISSGGLTVIANAPNPAGQSLLQKFFPGGISPLKLLLAAALPTSIVSLCFLAGLRTANFS